VPLPLQFGNALGLLLGEDLGEVVIDAEILRHGARHCLRVTCQHGHLHPHSVEARHGRSAFGANQVGQRQRGHRLAVANQIYDALPASRRPLAQRGQGRRQVEVLLREQPVTDDLDRVPVRAGSHAAPLESLKVGDLGDGEASLFRGMDDGPGDGMLRVVFDGRGERQGAILAERAVGGHLGEAELATRKSAGLVQDHRIHLTQGLHGPPVPHQDAVPCSQRGGDGDHKWDGQAQRMRAGNNQYRGNACHNPRVEALRDRPGERRHQGHAQGHVEKPAGGAVGQDLAA